MRLSGVCPEASIKNEADVIASMCEHGGHQNIVKVLGHGWLKGSFKMYYIDMELASLTLEQYLQYHKNESVEGVDVEAIPVADPVFVRNDCDSTKQIANMWVIGMHIAGGLEFMHSLGHVHRDLKPSNGYYLYCVKSILMAVLYCPGEKVWKLTDFGISASATTSRAQVTRHARGSSSYRAPEILTEEPEFTNRLDMWSLGCVLHQIATKRVAFKDDWAVQKYDHMKNSIMEINLTSTSEFLQHHVSESLRALLHREPKKRPSASLVSRLFSSYRQIFELPSAQGLYVAPLYPLFQQWQQTIDSYVSKPKIISQLALAKLFEYHDNRSLAQSLRDDMIQAYIDSDQRQTKPSRTLNGDPKLESLHNLGKLLTSHGLDDEALVVYEKLLNSYPDDLNAFIRLAELYTKKKQDDQALHLYRTATKTHPRNFWSWRNLCNYYVERDDYHGAIKECADALIQFPRNISIVLLLVYLYCRESNYSSVAMSYMDHIDAPGEIKQNWLSAISKEAPDDYSQELRKDWYCSQRCYSLTEFRLNESESIGNPHGLKAIISPYSLFTKDIDTEARILPPHPASLHGYPAHLASAIERGIDVDVCENGWTPLHLAVWNMHFEVVKMLLNSPTPGIESRNSWGWTALHLASWNNDVEIMGLLLQAVNISEVDDTVCGELHVAAGNSSVDALRVLLKAGADVSGPASRRESITAMHVAARRGDLACVNTLLELGADVSARADDGKTPVHYAALHGKAGILKTLVEAGGDIYEADGDGKSAMDYAMEGVVRGVGRILEERDRSISVRLEDGSNPPSTEAVNGVCDLLETVSITTE